MKKVRIKPAPGKKITDGVKASAESVVVSEAEAAKWREI
jgi:hypothetical protein